MRRAAVGVLRILIEGKQDIDLMDLFETCSRIYNQKANIESHIEQQTVQQVFDFTMERSKSYFQSKGFSLEEYAAVSACHPTRPFDFFVRLKALNQFFIRKKSAAESLASANKRITNILNKAEYKTPSDSVDKVLMSEEAENSLASSMEKLSSKVNACFREKDYSTGLETLAELKDPVDEYFDSVMVMHEDEAIRNNRLALLAKLRALFLGVADISKIRIDS